MNEASVQSMVRLEASRRGWKLWRNNLGAGQMFDGRMIRWGLANDSKAMNTLVKSGDLIGIRPVVITQDMVGTVLGQFVSIECKRENWKPSMTDEHEQAQMRWAELVLLAGGHAEFTTGNLT